MKFTIHTLGCKVNQYETQAMETLLRERGHTPVVRGAQAVIINTCAVTAESARKSRQAVRRVQQENPGAVVAVCGCFAQVSPEDAAALGADLVFGSGQHRELVEALERAFSARDYRRQIQVDDPFKRRLFEPLPAGSVAGRTRAMLKIEDGCDNFCTYCIIPYARGRVRSLPPEDAARQAAQLAAEGYRELVLTGIEIASYGKDLRDGGGGHPGLAEAVEAITQAAPGLRLRLGSLEPTIVTEDFCRRLARLNTVCRHFHLSLQSGCDRTLAAMHRKYDTARFYHVTERLRAHFPGCALTADLITGFPGETETDHQETLAFIRRCGFSSMHIFPYSERPGTPAAEMTGRVEKAIRARRAHEAQAVADEMARAYLAGCVGQVLPVLFETEADGCSQGHADNYCLVSVPGGRRGLVNNVKILDVSGEMLVGKAV